MEVNAPILPPPGEAVLTHVSFEGILGELSLVLARETIYNLYLYTYLHKIVCVCVYNLGYVAYSICVYMILIYICIYII